MIKLTAWTDFLTVVLFLLKIECKLVSRYDALLSELRIGAPVTTVLGGSGCLLQTASTANDAEWVWMA
jgi:hypothetical protein